MESKSVSEMVEKIIRDFKGMCVIKMSLSTYNKLNEEGELNFYKKDYTITLDGYRVLIDPEVPFCEVRFEPPQHWYPELECTSLYDSTTRYIKPYVDRGIGWSRDMYGRLLRED